MSTKSFDLTLVNTTKYIDDRILHFIHLKIKVMIQSIRKIRLPFFLFFLLLTVVSCDTEEDASIVEIENLADSSIEELQSRIIGKKHCVEFVFPITISFVDSTTAEVSDYTDLYDTVVAWFTENDVEKTKENKPSLVFPIEVVNQEGEIIQLESKEELRELKSECPREGKCKDGKKGKGHHCFDLVFPVSMIIDGETLSFEDRASLKEAIRAYKENAEEEAVRPELVFPLSIEYEDGSITEVTSAEELQSLKEACKNN